MTLEATDIIVETWRVLQEYIPEKDKAKAGEHWIGILQDNGVDKETLDALAESDDVLIDPINDLDDELLYEEEDFNPDEELED
tara:strand:+ start:718 stop:966 length:249 start_codon:yes stop_codon:yes gene_type:complete